MTIIEAIKRAQQTAPVNVEGLARDLGVRVTYPWVDDDISGELRRMSGDKFEISVNGTHAPTRRRFTLAHELGHFIYHRDLIGDGVDDNRAYRRTSTARYALTRIGTHEETEANRFAANLLMPMHLINQLRGEGLTRQQMAKRLEVSEHALAIRLGESYP